MSHTYKNWSKYLRSIKHPKHKPDKTIRLIFHKRTIQKIERIKLGEVFRKFHEDLFKIVRPVQKKKYAAFESSYQLLLRKYTTI